MIGGVYANHIGGGGGYVSSGGVGYAPYSPSPGVYPSGLVPNAHNPYYSSGGGGGVVGGGGGGGGGGGYYAHPQYPSSSLGGVQYVGPSGYPHPSTLPGPGVYQV